MRLPGFVKLIRRSPLFSPQYTLTDHFIGHSHSTRSCSSSQPPKEHYELAYKFPYIVPLRVMSRFKIYQTGVTILMVPILKMEVEAGNLLPGIATTITGAAVAALGTMYVIGNLTRRMVCLVGVNRKNETVKLARMTFWGNRKDIVLPMNSIVHLHELPGSPGDLYTDVITHDGQTKLHISLKYGGIHDVELFKSVFGTLR